MEDISSLRWYLKEVFIKKDGILRGKSSTSTSMIFHYVFKKDKIMMFTIIKTPNKYNGEIRSISLKEFKYEQLPDDFINMTKNCSPLKKKELYNYSMDCGQIPIEFEKMKLG